MCTQTYMIWCQCAVQLELKESSWIVQVRERGLGWGGVACVGCVLLCFIDPRVRMIRNEASRCPGIFSRTFRFFYLPRWPPPPSSNLKQTTFLIIYVSKDTSESSYNFWSLSMSSTLAVHQTSSFVIFEICDPFWNKIGDPIKLLQSQNFMKFILSFYFLLGGGKYPT